MRYIRHDGDCGGPGCILLRYQECIWKNSRGSMIQGREARSTRRFVKLRIATYEYTGRAFDADLRSGVCPIIPGIIVSWWEAVFIDINASSS